MSISPRPWRIEQCGDLSLIFDAEGREVLFFDPKYRIELGGQELELIVRLVNAEAEIVAALELSITVMEGWATNEEIDLVRAALAKVRL